jgi:hypothetical protein
MLASSAPSATQEAAGARGQAQRKDTPRFLSGVERRQGHGGGRVGPGGGGAETHEASAAAAVFPESLHLCATSGGWPQLQPKAGRTCVPPAGYG